MLKRVLSVREEVLYNHEFFSRQRGQGVFADQVANIFEISCRKHGISAGSVKLNSDKFNNPYSKQLDLFKTV